MLSEFICAMCGTKQRADLESIYTDRWVFRGYELCSWDCLVKAAKNQDGRFTVPWGVRQDLPLAENGRFPVREPEGE